MNVCSYHLQEAGATPVQELSYALATAIAVLDTVKATGEVDDDDLPGGGRPHLVLRQCRHPLHHRDVQDARLLRALGRDLPRALRRRRRRSGRFRYGVQVNSLGLTEQQPENNVYRILLEMLAVVLSKNARARAVQLPAWNEALGLPRPWDQQWSLRMQQIMAYETDLLDYGDIFDGSHEVTRKVEELKEAARAELTRIEAMGGAIVAVENGYMKRALVESNAARLAAIEAGEQIVVGVNRWTETEPSPLTSAEGTILTVPETVEMEAAHNIRTWRARRDRKAVDAALDALEAAAREGRNIMEPSIAAAKAGVTTGEWGETLRRIFGEYRAPTGVHARDPLAASGARRAPPGRRPRREARRNAAPRRRQARPRWPFQRRRTGGAARPRHRHGRDL